MDERERARKRETECERSEERESKKRMQGMPYANSCVESVVGMESWQRTR